MRYQHLVESHPPEMIMYHGTYGEAAKRIAKKGLIARPTDRHYAANDPDNYHLASLNGVYFTNQFEVAVGYAFKASEVFSGDWCAVVMAKVPLADAVPDEDVVMAAMHEAERTKNPDAFVRAFHRNLVQDRPIPIRPDLLTKVRDAYANLEQAEDDASLLRNVQRYRRALDQTTRAYAAMVFDTHPAYYNGNHTMRLPRGLPVQNVLSVTRFAISFPQEDNGYPPEVDQVVALRGQPFSQEQLQAAVDQLQERDFFS